MIQKSVFKQNAAKLKIPALLQTADDEVSLAQEELQSTLHRILAASTPHWKAEIH